MKVVKCVKGHFFDEDKYAQCPHCGESTANVGTSPENGGSGKQETSDDKKKKHWLFGGKKKEEAGDCVINEQQPQNMQNVAGMYQTNQMQQQNIYQNPVSNMNMMGNPTNVNADNENTILIEPVTPAASVMERPQPMVQPMAQPTPQQMPQPMAQPAPQQMPQPMAQPAPKQMPQPMAQATPQQMPQPMAQPAPQQMPQPMAQPTPQPVPQQMPQPGMLANIGNDMQTVAFYDAVTEPVVGWIVCVKGECYGESYELKAGRNNIGRATNMDVPLIKELSVSRDKHAIIVFDPVNCKFIMQSGENGLTYVNGELLMGTCELKAYDKLMLGTAVYMFIPFCGSDFDWKDYSNK